MVAFLKKYTSGLIGIVGSLVTILVFIFPAYSATRISISYFVVTVFVLLTIIIFLIKLLIDATHKITDNIYFNNFSIKPIQLIKPKGILISYQTAPLPLYLTVSIFINDNNYEEQICTGYLFHIQDKFYQFKLNIDNAELIEQISGINTLEKIRIKPYVFLINDLSIKGAK